MVKTKKNEITEKDKKNPTETKFAGNIRIKALQISLASYETIHSWSYGEVVNSETINYKSLKPEKGGLFDEAIFGPTRDYECYCGKYKKVKHRGKVCEVCGVEITEAIVRRERMGHIELAAPVAHIWMVKELPSPSKISLLLDISYKEVERVVYFVNYIVLDVGKVGSKFFKPKQIIDLSSKDNSAARNGLRRVLKYIAEKLPKSSPDWQRAQVFYSCLRDNNLPFSIDDAFRFIQKYTGIRFGIGAEAILELLRKLNLNKEYKLINEKIKKVENSTDVNAKKLIRRLELVKLLRESDNKPEDMILRAIPVVPPDARPIIQLEGARFTTSDINNFYRRIIIRNERLKKVIQLRAPAIILNNEKRMLQEVVDSLFDNASRKKPIVNKDKRPLKSLTDRLKGKQGLFRQNLLGKRVDFSGRSVIVVGPELKMYEVGLPAIMVLKLFKPFIIHELIKRYEDGFEIKPIASNIKVAERMLLQQDDAIWPVVEKVLKDRPVLLNRAPTLHRLSIQAFEPKLVSGKAIRLHPLVTTAFNADFDGDQMAVHLPLSKEAVAEARSVMLASLHILGPKDGKPVVTPTQDMVLGIYYLTTEKRHEVGEGIIFTDYDEIVRALANKKVTLHTFIGLATSAYPQKFKTEGVIITTVGKVILNHVMPTSMHFLNDADINDEFSDTRIVPYGSDPRKMIEELSEIKPFDKKTLSLIINRLYSKFPDEVARVLDQIKELGFNYSTSSSTTVSIFDIPSYDKKWDYIVEADKKISELKHQFNKGLLDDDERYQRVVKIWTDVKEIVSTDIKNLINSAEFADNSIVIMAQSGARGNISNFTQLFGMRGLMSKSYNYEQKQQSSIIKDIIEIPIKHSFLEGLTISEFFNGSFGARKGMTDTAMKTSRSGYMTRKLVDSAQEVIVMKEDCGTTKGIYIEPIVETETRSVFENIADRIVHRYVMEDVINPKTNEVIVPANTVVTPEQAEAALKAGVKRVLVRSVLNCRVEQGICQKCFGDDLTTNKPIEIGVAIGVIAAQSIGEPGMQLTMRTFHTGGVSGSTNITQGFERLKQLFDVIPPKDWESCVISEIDGKVETIEDLEDGKRKIVVVNKLDSRDYIINADAKCRVSVGSEVKIGSKLIEGSVELKSLLRLAGIDAVRTYLVREVQKVYRIQGIEIADKYIEIIVRQLTNKMKVQDPGDSDYFVGQIINVNSLNNTNNKLLSNNKRPAIAISQIFGLDEAPSKTGSFLSAASFQDTKKILTEAAVSSQVDQLAGLKENVIVGNLIPVGTGIEKDINRLIKAGEEVAKKEYK